jgi:hypothetical protein
MRRRRSSNGDPTAVRSLAPGVAAAALASLTLACSLFGSGAEPETPEMDVQPSPTRAATATTGSTYSGGDPFQSTATPTVSPEELQQAFSASGTITAMLDGEPRVWHTGSMETDGGPIDLSSWYHTPLQTFPDLYGFEIYAVPEETFTEGGGAEVAQASGAALTIDFSVDAPLAGQTLDFPLPSPEGLTSAEIGYIGVDGEQYVQFEMAQGSLQVTLVEAAPNEAAKLEGTFQGTLTYAGALGDPQAQSDPSRSIEISEGEFSIQALPYDGASE